VAKMQKNIDFFMVSRNDVANAPLESDETQRWGRHLQSSVFLRKDATFAKN